MSKLRSTAAVVVLGVGVLTGCSGSPGTAAVIDGREISQADVTAIQQDLAVLQTEPPPADAVVLWLVFAPYYHEAAEEAGIGRSDAETRGFLDQEAQAAGATEVPEWDPATIDVARYIIAWQDIQALPDGAQVVSDIEAEVWASDLVLNPRYGDLDRERGTITTPTPTWIVPAPPVTE